MRFGNIDKSHAFTANLRMLEARCRSALRHATDDHLGSGQDWIGSKILERPRTVHACCSRPPLPYNDED
jgi:hypothetical protein